MSLHLHCRKIVQVLCDMPTLDVSILLIGQLHDNPDANRSIKQPMTKDHWIEVHQGQEYTIQVSFHRLQRSSQQQQQHRRSAGAAASVIPKVHSPKFPKGKDEGWFLTLGDSFSGELLALKRCAYRNNRSSHQISFRAPNQIGKPDHYAQVKNHAGANVFHCLIFLHTSGRSIYTIYLMSDAYIGLDQQYDINMDIIPCEISSGECDYDDKY